MYNIAGSHFANGSVLVFKPQYMWLCTQPKGHNIWPTGPRSTQKGVSTPNVINIIFKSDNIPSIFGNINQLSFIVAMEVFLHAIVWSFARITYWLEGYQKGWLEIRACSICEKYGYHMDWSNVSF